RFHCRDPEVLAVLRVFPLVHRETGSVPEYLGTTQGLAQLWSRHIWSNLDRRTIRGFPNIREVFPAVNRIFLTSETGESPALGVLCHVVAKQPHQLELMLRRAGHGKAANAGNQRLPRG